MQNWTVILRWIPWLIISVSSAARPKGMGLRGSGRIRGLIVCLSRGMGSLRRVWLAGGLGGTIVKWRFRVRGRSIGLLGIRLLQGFLSENSRRKWNRKLSVWLTRWNSKRIVPRRSRNCSAKLKMHLAKSWRTSISCLGLQFYWNLWANPTKQNSILASFKCNRRTFSTAWRTELNPRS